MDERQGSNPVMRVAGVIGHPVAHSLSPVIHNAAFTSAGLDWTYAAFDVAPGGGAEAVDAMRTLGLGGLSVTMPHKDAVAVAVDRCSPAAAALRAANCVAWEDDQLVGHNTDGDGFLDALVAETGTGIDGSVCLVVGAGGAARAVCRALGHAGAARVGVANRTTSRAAAAAALAGPAGVVVATDDAVALRSADIVVNATSMGMSGTDGAGLLPVDVECLHDGQIVVDLVYHPVQTPLLAAASDRGALAVIGVGMLVHQAARQFELWTGTDAPIAVMTAAARSAIERRDALR